MNKKIIISDYGWLPDNIEESWIYKTNFEFKIYDKKHRLNFKKYKEVIYQKNVGQNIYDILDHIIENYYNLDEITIFCRGCILFPKNRKKPLSNGNCSEKKFFELIKKEKFTEIHDYESEIQNGTSSYVSKDGGYYEKNTSWYLRKHKPKFFITYNLFMTYIFSNYEKLNYVRFSPGAAYLIPKKNILYYDIKFYKVIKKFVSWNAVVGDAHIVERALYYIFSNTYTQRKSYSNVFLFFNRLLVFTIYFLIYVPIEILLKLIR